MSKTDLDKFFNTSSKLASRILQAKPELIRLLSRYETQETALDEIQRSVEALKGMQTEFLPLKRHLQDLNIATFFPLNLPLYSLVLFAIAPAAFAKNVFVRPPEVMHKMLLDVVEFLDIKKLFPNISVHAVPRYTFMDLYASECDAIIFTGKYENALAIQRECPQALLIYNGSGINPFLIFSNADIDLVVKKAIDMRLFNSGQDCAGPDLFFVPTIHADSFVGKLQKELEKIKVGNSSDPSVRVSRTIKESYIQQLKPILEKERENLIYGGHIDEENHLVPPAIILKPIKEHDTRIFHEFFAPIFYVLEYSTIGQLEKVLHSPKFIERSMYISVFGDNEDIEKKLKFAKILKNKIVNDVELGNEEYGGWGAHANFLIMGSKTKVKPVLISRDLHLMLA